jgi:hypothetical protein
VTRVDRGCATLQNFTVRHHSIGIDIPQDIKVARVYAYFPRIGCSFQQLCQAMLRARHVQSTEMHVQRPFTSFDKRSFIQKIHAFYI